MIIRVSLSNKFSLHNDVLKYFRSLGYSFPAHAVETSLTWGWRLRLAAEIAGEHAFSVGMNAKQAA